MDKLYNKAITLGASDFGPSKQAHKRFFVRYNNKLIHFGSPTMNTYYDHQNKKTLDNWLKRHSKMTNKKGEFVINNPESASFWSHQILWT